MVPQVRVVSGDECQDVAGGQRVARLLLHPEELAVHAADHVQAVGSQDIRHISSRLALSLGAGLAAFEGGGGQEGHVFLHRSHGLAVIQRAVGAAELRGCGRTDGQQRQERQYLPHKLSLLRIQASAGQKRSVRTLRSEA